MTGMVPKPTINQYIGAGFQQKGNIMGVNGGAYVTYSTKLGA